MVKLKDIAKIENEKALDVERAMETSSEFDALQKENELIRSKITNAINELIQNEIEQERLCNG